MLSESIRELEFIEDENLKQAILDEINNNGVIKNEKALKFLGCLLINYIVSIENNNRIAEQILEHKKVVNKMLSTEIELNRDGYKINNRMKKEDLRTTIMEEMFFALVDFKSNFVKVSETTNIEATFFGYINSRVHFRVRDSLKFFRYESTSGKLTNDFSELWQDKFCIQNYIEEKEIRRELKKYFQHCSTLEQELIYMTMFENINYKVLEEKYGIRCDSLRKKKERAIKKIRKMIPANSILLEEAI